MVSTAKAYGQIGLIILVGSSMSLILLTLLGGITKAATYHFDSPQEVSATTYTYTEFLPIMMRQYPCDFSGYATLNNAPTTVVLGLSQATPRDKTTIYTTTTNQDGTFCFSNVPILSSCDSGYRYAVYFGYLLPAPSQEYAIGWGSALYPRCQASQVYTDIHAELSDITVLTPTDSITATLPITFSWIHPSVPNGYYSIRIGDCWPVNVGYSTTYVLRDMGCTLKPWAPTYWYVNENAGGTRQSQYHWLTIQLP